MQAARPCLLGSTRTDMPRLALNFSGKQRSLQVWNPLLGGALLLSGIIALGIAGYEYNRQLSLNADLQGEYAGLQDRTQRQRNNVPLSPSVVAELEQANIAYELTRTPWEKIFTALEAARDAHPDDIALLAIRIDASKLELSITGEAKDFAALSAFTSALSGSPEFQNVSLTNDKLSVGSMPIVVVFDLRLNWTKPDAPQEAKTY